MKPAAKIRQNSFIIGGFAVISLVLISLVAGKGPQWLNPWLYVFLGIVWVFISAWFYKIDLDAESKRAIVDTTPRD